jgi:hypothetical protein
LDLVAVGLPVQVLLEASTVARLATNPYSMPASSLPLEEIAEQRITIGQMADNEVHENLKNSESPRGMNLTHKRRRFTCLQQITPCL